VPTGDRRVLDADLEALGTTDHQLAGGRQGVDRVYAIAYDPEGQSMGASWSRCTPLGGDVVPIGVLKGCHSFIVPASPGQVAQGPRQLPTVSAFRRACAGSHKEKGPESWVAVRHAVCCDPAAQIDLQ
jgi:hypothetical protein